MGGRPLISHWRVGRSYQLHVYEVGSTTPQGDRPVATFHQAADAAAAVSAHNTYSASLAGRQQVWAPPTLHWLTGLYRPERSEFTVSLHCNAPTDSSCRIWCQTCADNGYAVCENQTCEKPNPQDQGRCLPTTWINDGGVEDHGPNGAAFGLVLPTPVEYIWKDEFYTWKPKPIC